MPVWISVRASKPSSWVPKPPGKRAMAEASFMNSSLRVKKYLKFISLGSSAMTVLVRCSKGRRMATPKLARAGAVVPGPHDAVAGAGDDHPVDLAHPAGELVGLDVLGAVHGVRAEPKIADLADVVVRGEDLEGVAQLLERVGQEPEVAAVGAVAGQARDGDHQVGQDVAVAAIGGEAGQEIVDGGVAGGGPVGDRDGRGGSAADGGGGDGGLIGRGGGRGGRTDLFLGVFMVFIHVSV